MGKNNARDGARFEEYLKRLARDGKLEGGEPDVTACYELPAFCDSESEGCVLEVGFGASGDPLFMFSVSLYGDKAARLLSFLRELDDEDDDEEGGVH